MLKKNVRDDRYGDPNRFGSEHEPEYEDLPVATPMEEPAAALYTAPAANAAVVPAPAARGHSVIDENSSFDGRFEAVQDMVVLGTISGEIVCKGLLTIEREATAKARIQSRDAHILGRVEGDIVCSGRLVLAASSNVSGTIKAAALVVEEGARISGSVETSASPSLDLTSSLRPAVVAAPASTKKVAEPVAEPTAAAVQAAPAAAGGSTARWTRSREVPSFALVSSEDRGPSESN